MDREFGIYGGWVILYVKQFARFSLIDAECPKCGFVNTVRDDAIGSVLKCEACEYESEIDPSAFDGEALTSFNKIAKELAYPDPMQVKKVFDEAMAKLRYLLKQKHVTKDLIKEVFD